MFPPHPVLLFLAAVLGGAMNSVAGGGGFIAFPALIFAGLPPVNANATNTVALWPASVASAGAYRGELRGPERWRAMVPFFVVTFIGCIVGALLMIFGAIAGGYGGAWYAQKLDQKVVRYIVIAIGAGMTVYFFWSH